MDSSSDSSTSIGATIGFIFRLAGGSVATNHGSLETGAALLGAGRAGSGRSPCGGGKDPKADARCWNRPCCGEAWVSP